MLGDKENSNCDLNIEFVYPVSADKDRLPMLQKDFVSAFFGHDYDSLPPKQAIKNTQILISLNTKTWSKIS